MDGEHLDGEHHPVCINPFHMKDGEDKDGSVRKELKFDSVVTRPIGIDKMGKYTECQQNKLFIIEKVNEQKGNSNMRHVSQWHKKCCGVKYQRPN